MTCQHLNWAPLSLVRNGCVRFPYKYVVDIFVQVLFMGKQIGAMVYNFGVIKIEVESQQFVSVHRTGSQTNPIWKLFGECHDHQFTHKQQLIIWLLCYSACKAKTNEASELCCQWKKMDSSTEGDTRQMMDYMWNAPSVKKTKSKIIYTEDGIPVRKLYFSNLYKNVSV